MEETYLDPGLIKRYFLLFSDLADTEAWKWEIVCKNAGRIIRDRLKPGADAACNRDRLCAAAAGVAYSDYLMIGGASSISADEVRVGDITLKNSSSSGTGTGKDASELRDYFLTQVADLVEGGDFVFLTTGKIGEEAET